MSYWYIEGKPLRKELPSPRGWAFNYTVMGNTEKGFANKHRYSTEKSCVAHGCHVHIGKVGNQLGHTPLVPLSSLLTII